MRWALLAGAACGAALGSRLLYVLQYWSTLQHVGPAAWLGGKTLVGGLLGAIAGVEIAKRLAGWRASTGDGFLWPLVAAILIGRIGCQLGGLADLTYGNATSLPWGWDYGDGLRRHPAALYEIAAVAALALAVARWRVPPRAGDRFRAFVIGYLLVRIALDLLKPPFDPPAAGLPAPGQLAGLTPIQWACIAGLLYHAGDLRRWFTTARP